MLHILKICKHGKSTHCKECVDEKNVPCKHGNLYYCEKCNDLLLPVCPHGKRFHCRKCIDELKKRNQKQKPKKQVKQ